MVGRGAELATVRGLVDAVRRGRGAVVLVVGEAGVGKSRLLGEAARYAADAGLLVSTGRAVQGGGTFRAVAEALVTLPGAAAPDPAGPAVPDGLRPYRAALGRILPGWAAPGAGPESGVDPTLVLGEGLLRLLSACGGERGCLLVLEDLHWADADTVALVEYLAGAARRWPVLVAVSARDDEPTSGAVGRLRGCADVTALALRRLGAAEARVLVARCAGDAVLPDAVTRAVVEWSEGLPLLVEELVAGLSDAGAAAGLPDAGAVAGPPAPGGAPVPVPPTFRDLVAGRLATLSPDQRRVVTAAAVLGTDPDWTVLGPVTGLPEEVVLGALRAAHAHLFAPADRLRWRHALTRDAVLATLTAPERAALARRAADVLLRRGEPHDDAHAGDLLAGAGDHRRSAEIFLRLARDDVARGALRNAQNLLDRAAGTGALRPTVAVERVRLLTVQGRVSAALEFGARAVGGMVGAEHADLCLLLADAAIATRRWTQAQSYLDRAGRPDDPRALALAADAAFGAGDLRRATDLAAAAVERAGPAGHREARCRAMITLARCAARDDPATAQETYRRAAQLAAEDGLRPLRVAALIGLATVELNERATSPALAEARGLALDAGQLAQTVWIDLLLIDGVCTVDGPRAAEAPARDVAERAGRLRLPALQAVAEVYVGLARAADGDVDGMRAALDAAAGRAYAPVEVRAGVAVAGGLRHLLGHDLRRAAAAFDRGMRMLVGHGGAAPVPVWGLWALLNTVAGDRDGEARDIVRGSAAVLRAVNRGGLQYADAVAAGRAGRPAEAAALLAAADRTVAAYPWWHRLLRLLALEAAVADGWTDPVPALRADLAVFERTGEALLARTCRDLLRRAGVPTRRGRGGTPVPAHLRAVGVTSREMDVLELVAEGLTNRQIAERLFLSRRTVDTPGANLLAKPGAAGRADLRAAATPTR